MGLLSARLYIFIIFLVKLKAGATDDKYDLLDQVIGSVSNITQFFEKESKGANLDGIFGVFSSQCQLAALLEKVSQKCLPQEIKILQGKIDNLTKLQAKLQLISEIEIPRIAKDHPDYFKKVACAFQPNVWKFLDPLQNTNTSLLYPKANLSRALFDEELSDNCISEWDKNKCNISVHCWRYASQLYKTEYYITHQYLFLLIGRQYGCEKEMNKMAKSYNKNIPVTTTAQLIKIFCTNILNESEILAKDGYPVSERDLFMEQMALCGMTGYHKFFQPKWIKTIIGWQQPSGCFKYYDTGYKSSKVKREEVQMNNGCLSHKTTVALIALQQSIRYLLEPDLQSNCQKWNEK